MANKKPNNTNKKTKSQAVEPVIEASVVPNNTPPKSSKRRHPGAV